MLWCELIDVLIVCDFFLWFLCWKVRLVVMVVVKVILSFYCSGEEKFVEWYKIRVKVMEEYKLFFLFRKNVIEFFGINE